MVSPTSLAGTLTAAAALLILAPHVSALPAVAPSSIVPAVVASQATPTPAVEATPEATATAAPGAPEAVTTAAPDIRARAPGQVRPLNLQKTHIFDYYAAPAGYRGFGKNRGRNDWQSRKNLQKEMNKMRPDRFWKPRRYTPYDEYDGGPLNKRGEPETEEVAEPEPMAETEQKEEEQVSEPNNILSKRGEPEPEKVAEPVAETEQKEEEQEQQVSKPNNILAKRGDYKPAAKGGSWVLPVPPFYFGVSAYGPNYNEVWKYTHWDSPSEPGQFAKHRGRTWRRDVAGESEDVPAVEPEEQEQQQQEVTPEAEVEAEADVNINGIRLPYPVNTATVDPSYDSPFVTLLVQADPTAAATPTPTPTGAEAEVEGETEVASAPAPTATPVYI